VWWLGTKSEENAKRMKKARRRKGEMRGKTLLRKIRHTTSVKQGNRCNIIAMCKKPIFFKKKWVLHRLCWGTDVI